MVTEQDIPFLQEILYIIYVYIFFYNCFEQLCDMNSRKVVQVTYYTYTSTSISTLLVTAKLTSLYQYVCTFETLYCSI